MPVLVLSDIFLVRPDVLPHRLDPLLFLVDYLLALVLQTIFVEFYFAPKELSFILPQIAPIARRSGRLIETSIPVSLSIFDGL